MPLIRYTKECLDAAEGLWPASGGQSPDGEKRKRPITIRVFENGFIENVLGKAHPITPIVWFGPFIAWGFYRTFTGPEPVGKSLGLMALGYALLSLVEYCVHRFLFHFDATTKAQRFNLFMMHGYHHEFPNDPMRLVAPPLMSWPIGLVLFAIYYLVFGEAGWLQVFAGSSMGYIAYDWVHYYTHHFKPSNPLGKWLRDYHLQHHFDHRPARYGVSTPFWDLVFGTYLPAKRASKPQAEA